MLLDPVVFPVFIAIVAIVILAIFFHFVPFFLWLSAKVSGVHISLIQLFLMRIRNVPPGVIVPSLIEAHKAGLKNITRDNLEAHYMTGGHVQRVVHALVSASKANIDLPFEKATAIDLAGRDVFEAVQTSVNPKVIDTPPVAAVAKNGIQLIAKARVTVRANIHQLVGGAGEDTILARVGEGIVSSIGSAETTSKFWKTRTPSPNWYSKRGWMPVRLLKSCPSTLPTSTWARTSVPPCKSTRPTPTRTSRKPRPRNVAPWPLPPSRK